MERRRFTPPPAERGGTLSLEAPNSLQSTQRAGGDRIGHSSRHAETKQRYQTENNTNTQAAAKGWVSDSTPPSPGKRKRPVHPLGLPSLASPSGTHILDHSSRQQQQQRHTQTKNDDVKTGLSPQTNYHSEDNGSDADSSFVNAQKTALQCVDHASRRQAAAKAALTASSQISTSLRDLMGDSNRALTAARQFQLEAETAAKRAEGAAKKVKEAGDVAAKDKQRANLELDEANAQAEEAWEFLRRVRGTPKGQKKKEDRHLKSKPARIGTVVEVRENSGNSGSPIPYTETKKQRSDEQRTGGLHVQWENTSRSVRLQKVPHQSDADLPNRQDISLVEPSRKFKGHSSPVTQIAAVGKNRFISSSWDTTIRMWNADTGECIRTFRGHGDWVHAISVLDSKHFISGSDDRTVKMWSFDKEECIRTFKGHSSFVKALAPMDGDRFLSGSRDRTIKLFSVTTGRCLRTFEGHVGVVSAIAALDSDHFATGSHDQNVKYWNVSSGTCVQTLTGHTGSIKTLAALSNKEVVSGSDDKTLRLWDVTTGKCLRQFGSKDSLVFSVSYICENFILSCGGSNVKLYHIPSGTCVKSYETPRISLAVVRLDDERFVTGSDQMLYLWKF